MRLLKQRAREGERELDVIRGTHYIPERLLLQLNPSLSRSASVRQLVNSNCPSTELLIKLAHLEVPLLFYWL